MGYKTKFVQELCSTRTDIYEEVIKFAHNKNIFFQNVRNLGKSSLEAFVHVLLMKEHGKVPDILLGNLIGAQDWIEVIHANNLRLQGDNETFGWVLSAFALMILAEKDLDAIRPHLEKLVKPFDTQYDELPLYYDVLRTLLIMAIERPELVSIFVSLDEEKMIRRLASESNVVRMKALACLQTMVDFNPKLFDVWLRMLQDTKLIVEHRSFMLHQLLATLLRLDNKQTEILLTIQCDQIWPIVLEGLASKVVLCRKEALATVQYIIGYAKQCGQDLHGTYFKWSQDKEQSEQLTNAWQSVVTIAEALNETQTHLILPALELIEKVAYLHVAWKNVLLRLILLHENPRVANYGIQFFLEQRSFDATDMVLETQFLQTFNQTTLFDNVAEIINGLKQYYREPEALAYVLHSIQGIGWNSVPYYCIVNLIHDQVDLIKTDEKACATALKSLTNSVKVCHDIKNVSLRYVTVLLLLKAITKYVSRCRTVSNSNQLLAVVTEIENLSPMFRMAAERFQDESGFTFCDAIAEDALLSHLPKVEITDTFFIKEMLFRRIVNAKPVEQEHLLRTISQSNFVIYLHLLHQLPESLRQQALDSFPELSASQVSEIKRAIQAKATITPVMFSAIREAFKVVHSSSAAPNKCFDGWTDIRTDLKNLFNDRLISFDYTQLVAVEMIQAAHLLAVDLRDFSCAQKFFQAISIKELSKTFRRDRSTNPPIDQIYTMISEILLCHCQGLAANGERAFTTDADWYKLIPLVEIGNFPVPAIVLDILHTDSGTGPVFNDARFVVMHKVYRQIIYSQGTHHFMKLSQKFILALLRPYTKMSDEPDLDSVEIDPVVFELIDHFLEDRFTVHGLAIKVFEYVFQLPMPILLNWNALGKLLLNGMIYGGAQTRDQKIENDVADHCGLDISFKHHPQYIAKANARVRVLCILFLYRIVKSNHPDAVLFLLKLERMLMERFSEITKAKERYYADSITHRQKLRIVQALCVVLKLTGTKPYPLLEVMLYETNQPNINYLIELIVADSAIDTLTIANSLRNDKVKVSGIQSVFVILWLRCCQTNSLDEKYIYLLLPWTMAQNFSTRLYAQITITKLIAKFSPHPVEEGPFREIYAAVNSYLRQGNVERNIEKCMKDFRFNSVFDYGNLLTLENIFHNIPKVSVAPPEDVVETAILKECLQTLGLGESNLGQPLEFDELQSEKRENLFLAQSFGGADFVQRKIVPLKSLEPSRELLLGLPKKLCSKKMDLTPGLIVVASLVNRAPNLGGLARTSEIFAVKQFVINSLQDIDNKEFQALSMTAEKWLNLGELKAHKIVEYLEEMKAKGYKIVGAEQTTGSKPIQQLKFPRKSILVLGHEKNGLPAEVIRHLDLIGEIPQFGVVRSLNVHVTGAIFMWEYAKQHHVPYPFDQYHFPQSFE